MIDCASVITHLLTNFSWILVQTVRNAQPSVLQMPFEVSVKSYDLEYPPTMYVSVSIGVRSQTYTTVSPSSDSGPSTNGHP